jgi:pimeloyl-ACP methyl ester carboxylesterase
VASRRLAQAKTHLTKRVAAHPVNEISSGMQNNKIKNLSIPSITRNLGYMMLVLLSILLACLLALLTLLQIWSYPGEPRPFSDKNGEPLPGSISEKTFVTINGVVQGMVIKSKNVNNPVLLYLHGGMPEYFLTQHHPTGLEQYFTVVWWDQRGSGLSYSAEIPPETMSEEQFIQDTFTVTNYLRRRFGKDKIYLMAHSGGTFFGIQAAAQEPKLYVAYIGVAQMSCQLKSEVLAYEFMLNRFKEIGNTKMAQRLESSPVTMTNGTPAAYLSVRDEAMHTLGVGTTRTMNSVISGVFLPSLQFREYTLREKVNLWRGKFRSGVSSLWNQIIATDLTNKVRKLDLPVYFIHGIHDYTVSYAGAKDYFQQIEAPIKGFYTFEQSAHSPIFEEPERTLEIVARDILVGANGHADVED